MSTAAAIPNPFVYGQVLIPGKPFCSRPQLESSVPPRRPPISDESCFWASGAWVESSFWLS